MTDSIDYHNKMLRTHSEEIEKLNKSDDYIANVVRGLEIKLGKLLESHDQLVLKTTKDRENFEKMKSQLSSLQQIVNTLSENLSILSTSSNNISIDTAYLKQKTSDSDVSISKALEEIKKALSLFQEKTATTAANSMNTVKEMFKDIEKKISSTIYPKNYDGEIAILRNDLVTFMDMAKATTQKSSVDIKRIQDLEKNIALLFSMMKQFEDR